jgi:hypothetical protein
VVSSYSAEVIEIKSIDVVSSSESIDVKPIRENENRVQPGERVGVCRLVLHVPKDSMSRNVF